MNNQSLVAVLLIQVFLTFSHQTWASESDAYYHIEPIENVSDSKNALNFSVEYLGDSSNISVMNFNGNYDREIGGEFNMAARQAVLQEFYNHQPDEYDFVVIFTTFPVEFGNALAFNLSFENDVEGIGIPIFDNSLDVGSENLQALLDMNQLSNWELNPANGQFKTTIDVMLHEMMHRWGIKVKFMDGNNQISDSTLGQGGAHWNHFLNSHASIMYGSLWDDLGGNQFKTTAIRKSLSPLDLYLMGFREASTVPDFFIIENGYPGSRYDIPPLVGSIVTGNRVDISINDVIAAEGPRIPSAMNSQHEFNFRFVLLKSSSQGVDLVDIGRMVALQREFQKRFYIETSGLGEIVYSEPSGSNSHGSPDVLNYNPANRQFFELTEVESFIEMKQTVNDGYWADKEATHVRDTVLAIQFLQHVNQAADLNQAIAWLNEYQASNNDDLAWQLFSGVLNSAKQTEVINQLIENMNSDGGWGLTADSVSSLYDTALVLRSLAKSRTSLYSPSAQTKLFVENHINSDFGVGYVTGGVSSLTSSVLLLDAMNMLSWDPVLISNVTDFIVDKQNQNGGFGTNSGSVHETALVTDVLLRMGESNHSQVIGAAIEQLSKMQSVDGSFEGSVYSSSLASLVLVNDTRPNLTLLNTTHSSSHPVSGEIVVLNFDVNLESSDNLENIEVGIFNVFGQVSSLNIPLIQANETLNMDIELDTSSLMPGNSDFVIVVDPQNGVNETNEHDNSTNFSLNVIEQSETPELTYSNGSISYQPSHINTLPLPFDLSFELINLSSSSLQGVQVGLYKSIDGGNLQQVSQHHHDVAANTPIVISFSDTINESFEASFEYVVRIDASNQFVEVNETNNEFVIHLTKDLTLDFEILSDDIVVPGAVYAGQEAGFSYVVSNNGTVISPAYDVQIAIGDGVTSQVVSTQTLDPIAPGGSVSFDYGYQFNQTGLYEMRIEVDPQNAVSESNETNNTGLVSVDVLSNTLPNLTIQEGGIQAAADPGLEGQGQAFTVSVQNTSTVASGQFELTLMAQKPDEPPVELDSLDNLPGISGGGTESFVFNVNELDISGNVLIIASVDPSDSVEEFDESDNTAYIEYQILSKPDIQVSSGGLSLIPSIPVAGEAMTVDVSVANAGEQDIATLDAKVYTINSTTQSMIEVASDTFGPLNAGESAVYTFDFTYPTDVGVDQLRVVLDESQLIDEASEDNNSATITVGLQDSEFYLNNTYFSPNGDGRKDTVQIVFNLEQEDNYQITIRNELGQTVKLYEYFQFPQTRFGDVHWDGRGVNGELVPDGQYTAHIIGESTYYENELQFWLDTNRSSLATTLKDDAGVLFDLNCVLNEIQDAGVFSQDKKYLYVRSYTDKNAQIQDGVFRIKTDGSEIKPLLPQGFTAINRVRELYLNDGGQLIFRTTNPSNVSKLWILNPNTLVLSQLSTTGIEDFTVFDLSRNNLVVRHYENSQVSFSRISLNPVEQPVTIMFQPNVDSSSQLKRVAEGWVWGDWNSDAYDVYFRSDTNSNSVSLGSIDSQEGVYVSVNKRFLLLKGHQLVHLYRFDQGIHSVASFAVDSEIPFDFKPQFLLNNHVLMIDEKIKIYDEFGSQIVEVEHPYDYDHFVEQIIQQYGSLDNLIYDDSEYGDIIYSLSDVENLQIKIEYLKFALGGENVLYLTVTACMTGYLGIEGSFDGEPVVEFGSNLAPVNLKIDYSDHSNIEILELNNIAIRFPVFSEEVSHYFNMGSGLYEKNAVAEPAHYDVDFLSDYHRLNFNPNKNSADVISQLLVRNTNSNHANTCTPVFGDERAIFQSKNNLTAYISAEVFDYGVEITGSVFDQFLAQYTIEWKRKDVPNSNWNFILSGQDNQVNGLFNYWVPPEPGIYTLRLSAHDQAENEVYDEVEVVINEINANIKNPEVNPRHISPNSDGIQDVLDISYDLVKPINVVIEIQSESGFVVKRIVRNYVPGMVNDQFSWDGTDNNGDSVSDDEYQVVIDGMRFPISVDTQDPYVELEVTQYLAKGCCFDSSINARVALIPSLIGELNESYQVSTQVERFDETTGNWKPIREKINVNPHNYDELHQMLLRGHATDKAGNQGFTQEESVEVKKAVPVDIRRVVEKDSETRVFQAPLRSNGIQIKEIEVSEHPELTNPTFSDHLGITIQAKSFQPILNIEMKTTYQDSITGEEVENTTPLALSDLAVARTYLTGGSLVEVDSVSDLFQYSNEDGDYYLYFVQIEQSKFPDTTNKISVELNLNFADETIIHPFDISFSQKNGFLDFFKKAQSNPAYRGSELAPLAYEHMERAMFGTEGTADLWYFSDDQTVTYNPMVLVFEKDGISLMLIDQLELHYEEQASNYVSQYFKWDMDVCSDPRELLFIYHATDEEGNDLLVPFSPEPCLSIGTFTVWFDANAYCHNNATEDPTLKVLVKDITLPESVLEFPPHTLKVFLKDQNGLQQVLYEEVNPVLIDGRNYNMEIEIPKQEFNDGIYKFKIVFFNTEIRQTGLGEKRIQNEFTESGYIYIENNKAISAISSPTPNQRFCAVDTENGRFIPVNIVSTLSTDSPYMHSFAQITDGEHRDVTPNLLNAQNIIEYEEENRFRNLILEGSNVSEVVDLYADPEVESTTLLHEVINSTGVSYCVEVPLVVDAKLDADFEIYEHQFYEDKLLLSPDNDGVKDEVTFAQIIAGEDISLTVELFNHSGNQLMGQISSSDMVMDDQLTLSWDGSLGGLAVDDGKYVIKVTYKDSCLLTESHQFNVIVDTTPPLAEFVDPVNGTEVGFITEVISSVVEANLETVSIAYLYNGVWNPISINTQAVNQSGEHQVTGDLNLMGLPQGTYSMRLLAQDLLGHSAETIIDVSLPLEQNIFWQYARTPQFISPNSDGIQDQVNLTVGLNVQSDLVIDVQNVNSSTVNVLNNGNSFPSGSHQMTWDGRDTNGVVVPDGIYGIRTQASEVGQPLNSETLTVNVNVDSTFPAISFSVQDGAVIKGEGAVVITVNEINLKTLGVFEQSIEPPGAENQIASDLQTGTFDVWPLSNQQDHVHQIRATATDKAGNRTESSVQFEIDNTPPVINFATPENQSFAGIEEDSIIFSGTVTEKNFTSLAFHISPETEPAQWQSIHLLNILDDDKFHLEWPISVADGKYLVKLVATDRAGWESEVIHEITIDRQPPEVSITNPLDGSLNGSRFAVNGTANDLHLSFYHLSYRESDSQTPDQWHLFHSGIEPVVNDLIHDWTHALDSGEYLLRLYAQDESGLSAETTIEVSIDTLPPASPLYLQVTLHDQRDAHLTWQTSQSADLAGYQIYRNNMPLNQSLITSTSHQDLDLAEGEYTYYVKAVDVIGNHSLPSNVVSVEVDRTGPLAELQTPIDNQIIGGVFEVVGTATSPDDFLQYKLYYREQSQPLPGVLIGQSALPVIGQRMSELDTRLLVDGSTYFVRLEAQDTSLNTTVAEKGFVVDNTAPDVPINLTYQLTGGHDVELDWNANTESDLAGYLLYRNGEIISGNGTVSSSLLTTTNYHDLDVIDGLHTYHVVAVDNALNVSGASNSVDVNINTRAPDAYFTAPADGHEFETQIRLDAASDDSDIASMLFEYSTDETNWHVIIDDAVEPYYALFNPSDYGLSYGDVAFRVTATDHSAQVDLTPDQISAVYKDLTPPDSVAGLTGLVTGGQIQLNWTENTESDLAGYVVSRKRLQPNPESDYHVLTHPFEVDHSYLDVSLADGIYSYRVSSIDTSENQSEWVTSQDLTVYSIELIQPFSPLLIPASSNFLGQSEFQGEISSEMTNNAGTLPLPPTPTDSTGQFVIESVPLDVGDNELFATQTTAEGHTSKQSSVTVQLSPTPLEPVNPQAQMNGFDLNFTWESPEAGTIGYIPYINQVPFLPVVQLTDNLSPVTSSHAFAANRVLDGDEDTYWYASYYDRINGSPVYYQVNFQSATWITEVEINWTEYSGSNANAPSKYMLQYLSPIGWITQSDFSGTESATVNFTSELPYLTEAIRILMPMDEVDYSYFELSEIEIYHQPFINGLSYQSTLSDGNYDVQVSAINAYGFESDLTAVQSLVFGDVDPPESVTLQATVVNGNQVDLLWTSSSSNDVAHYRIYRNGPLIATTPDANTLTHLDLDLANGLYSYHVVAVDLTGNLSVSSNEEEVEISQQILAPPTGLVIRVVETGSALGLEWDQHNDPLFSHFAVYRSNTAGTGYEELVQTTSIEIIDENLINGTRYHYHVTAYDQFGNESLPSNEVSGVPFDSIHPDQPVITDPTTHGNPISVNTTTTDIKGFASPAVEVDLYGNNERVSTVASNVDYTLSEIEFHRSFDQIRFNSSNRYFAGYDYNNGFVVIADPVNDEYTSINDQDLSKYVWSVDGTKLYGVSGYGNQSSVKSFDLNGQELGVLQSGFSIERMAISSDESHIFYEGDGVNPDTSVTESGIWLYNLTDSSFKKLLPNESVNLREGSIVWLPDGNLAFINFPNGTYSQGELWHFDLNSDQMTLLDNETEPRSDLVNSRSGSHLYYVVSIDGNKGISRIQLSDESKSFYSKPGIDVSMPAVNDDIDVVMVSDDCCDKELVNMSSGDLINRFENVGYQQRVTWLVDGRIMYVDNGSLFFIEPPGRFVFPDVSLAPGLNEFYAIARKGNNLDSDPSESIEVTLNEAELADLEIKDNYLQLSPAQVFTGQAITGTVLVKNASLVDVEQSRLIIELIDPDFNTHLVEPAPLDFSLAAAEVLAVNFTVSNLNTLGEYTVRVFADSNQQIFESNENNNSTFKVFQVINDLDVDLETVVSQSVLAPGDDLNGLIRVYNPGEAFNGSVEARIVDERGYSVGYEASFSIQGLNSQATWQQDVNWNSGETFAGNYRLETVLFDENHQILEQEQTEFKIGFIAEYGLTLRSNRAQINTNETINLYADVAFLHGNNSQTGSLNWEVYDDQNQLVWVDTLVTTSMSPGFIGTFENDWMGTQPGSYFAKVSLTTETSDVSASLPFDVIPAAQQLNLNGLISELTGGVILGQTWNSNQSLQNSGQVNLVNVPITLALWDSQLNQKLGEQVTSVNLTVGEGIQLSNTWSSDSLELGNYVLVLMADLSAYGQSSEHLLDTQAVQTVDAVGPEIDLLNPTDQGFYLPNVESRTLVRDLHSGVGSVGIYLDSTLQVSMSPQAIGDTYQFRLTGLSDGIHQLRIEASDVVGNVSNQNISFAVDGTLPVIDIVGVSDRGLYNEEVQALVNITEANLVDSQIILNGVPYVSGDPITQEGSHILMVNATDAAGNSATERVTFVMDLTPPEVIISYPENNSQTNQNHTVVVGTTEVGAEVTLTVGAYTDTVTTDFEGSFNFVDVPLTNGQNIISVRAVDTAGNVGPNNSVVVTFTDDISVSGFVTAQGGYGLGETINVPWQISNLNDHEVAQLPVEVNLYSTKNNQLLLTDARFVSIGATATIQQNTSFDTSGMSVGNHRIELRVEIDQNWQTLDVDMIELQDRTGPELSVIEPVADQITQSLVELLVMANDEHSEVRDTHYMIGNNNIWIPLSFNGTGYEGQLNLTGGEYQITFRAEDVFNNETTSQPIQFSVDDTPPVINIIAPSDGLKTNQAVTIDFLVTDENGFTVEAQMGQLTVSNGFTVTDEGEYELTVSATDEVGNQSEKTHQFEIDTTAPIIILTSPEPGAQNTTGMVDVIGSAEERNTISISVNGVESTLKTDAQGGFVLLNQSLEEGVNLIEATATDQAGNVSEPVTREVTYTPVGHISGRVWQDADQDTNIGGSELGFNQVSLRLTDDIQQSLDVLTDSEGYFQFTDLPLGTYEIEVIEPSLLNEWLNTTNNNPTTVEVLVDATEIINFGFYQENASLDVSVSAHDVKGRMLLLVDPPTAQVDINQCLGTESYQLQRFVESEFNAGDSVWAKLYDEHGTLLQTETANFTDFENNGYQSIDNEPESNDFNLVLHPVVNRHIRAEVNSSSSSNPAVLTASYRVVLGMELNGQSHEWSSALIAPDCQVFDAIGNHTGELRFSNANLNPAIPSDDPNSQDGSPHLIAQQIMLETMLLDAGWSYHITTDATEFAAELSKGEFVAYWLMAENTQLSSNTQNDLMLAVEAGAGLMVSSGHDNLTTQFYSSLGATVTGTHLTATELQLLDGVLTDEDVLPINHDEEVLKISVTDGDSAGVFNGLGISVPEYHAIVLNDYSENNSVFSGFDWLLQATDVVGMRKYAELTYAAINHINPLGLSNELGYARAIKVNLQNTGRAIEGIVEVTLPPTVAFVHSEVPVNTTQDGFTFQYDLAESELLQLEFWLKVEASPAAVTFDFYIENQSQAYETIDLVLVAGERPDISATLTNCQAGIKHGQALTYRFEVSNDGNKDIIGAEAFIDFDQALQTPVWTCSGLMGGSCSESSGSGGLSGSAIDLPVGSSVIYQFNTAVTNAVASSVLVSGQVDMPTLVSDVDPENNSALDFDQVYEFVFKNGFDCAAAGARPHKIQYLYTDKE